MNISLYDYILDFICNKNQQNAHFFITDLINYLSSTCFEHPSVHPQEDLYMQFYGTRLLIWTHENIL